MAHCDPQMTDLVNLPAPGPSVKLLWFRNDLDSERSGSSIGLGCSGNGVIAACTFAGSVDNLIVYDYDGNRLWSSGVDLVERTEISAPLIDSTGAVFACDTAKLIKVDPASRIVRWRTFFPNSGATPISPVATDNGIIILGTNDGPLMAFDAETGALLQSLSIPNSSKTGFYETINTVAVQNNRLYYLAQDSQDDRYGKLFAIDVVATANPPLTVVWSYEFGGPSGASPLVIGNMIYFDGDRPSPLEAAQAHVYAVEDMGSYARQVFKAPINEQNLHMETSFAKDPRGGFWTYAAGSTNLYRRNQATGAIMDTISVDALVNESSNFHVPAAAMTMAGTSTNPIMITSARSLRRGTQYIIAIDLAARKLYWKVRLFSDSVENSYGQFPILMRNNIPRVVFTSSRSGVRAIGK